ncbi:MAG TPA: beta-ketoacyl synthase chain length factor [Gallionella sp.]|nr:beta-ketoacyl synthase chain length factor [Gallionella sp.]
MTFTATLTAYIEGIGLLGPGLSDWPGSRAILNGQRPYQPAKTQLPSPALLPAAERRRSGAIVRLTLATGLEAIAAAGRDAASLPSVFSSSGGDGENCHAICEMLASNDRQISPTRFHNSVHNAAAGYWSIATGAMATSSVLSAFDASFGAGLLEALTQVVVDNSPAVLLTCDTAYPEPLYSARPIPDAFGIALVLAPLRSAQTLAQITVSLTDAGADRLDDVALEALRVAIPAARGLPLLRAIALGQEQRVVLDYLDSTRLAVTVAPC